MKVNLHHRPIKKTSKNQNPGSGVREVRHLFLWAKERSGMRMEMSARLNAAKVECYVTAVSHAVSHPSSPAAAFLLFSFSASPSISDLLFGFFGFGAWFQAPFSSGHRIQKRFSFTSSFRQKRRLASAMCHTNGSVLNHHLHSCRRQETLSPG